MKRISVIVTFVFLACGLSAQGLVKPGTVNGNPGPAFDCYRSFQQQNDMWKTFHDELDIKTRCFFAANTINSIAEPYCGYPPIWIGNGNYDWANLDAQMDDLVKYGPEGKFVCILDLNTPYWAIRQYGMDSYDFCSHFACDDNWFRNTMKWMDDFVAYAEKKYGDRIFAYILSGGGTSEWYEFRRGVVTPLKAEGWKKWRSAQGRPTQEWYPTEDKVTVAAFENRVYDPQTEPDKLDYWHFHNDIIADAIIRYAGHARKILPEGKQIGVFFGYFFVSNPDLSSFGHLGFEKVAACPDIDFLIAPGSYSNRATGEGTGSQTLFGTAMLNGKRFLHEIDYRPHAYYRGGTSWNTTEDDIAGNIREACFAIINHGNLWWFDMWGRFYQEKPVRDAISRMHEIFESFKDDNSASVSEVLYLADPESALGINEEADESTTEFFRNRMAKMGLPFDAYCLDDVTRLDLSQYKVIMLPTTVMIDADRAELLKKYICRDGRTIVWTYAPGLSDGRSLSIDRVKDWAGVPFKTDGISKAPMDGWTSVYAYDENLFTSEELKRICIEAGAHEYVEGTIPVFANEKLLCVHCKEGGVRTVKLPRRAAKVVELISGKEVAKRVKKFDYEFSSPDTRLFEVVY